MSELERTGSIPLSLSVDLIIRMQARVRGNRVRAVLMPSSLQSFRRPRQT